VLAAALTIAGSDPSGGAGIQADLKTFHQFGVYGEAVITLLTVQNTRHVMRVEVMEADLVRQQIEAVVTDIPPAAVKTGALGNAQVVSTVAQWAQHAKAPIIVDPVMISKHGARLLSPEAQQILKHQLIPHAFLVTPNLPEAEALTGQKNPEKAAEHLLKLGCRAVLIKGGHAEGEPTDLFHDRAGVLSVTDTGRGMAQEELKKLGAFRPSDLGRHDMPGMGLGLALVEKLASKCGARLTLTSTEGSGTRAEIAFSLKLPEA